jgi:hypothetical protein
MLIGSVRVFEDNGLFYWVITKPTGEVVYGERGFTSEETCKADAEKQLRK